MGLGGIGFAILDEEGFDVTIHREANLAIGHVEALIPGEVNDRELFSFPVLCYSSIEWLDNTKGVLSVALTNRLDAKLVNNEDKLEWAPLVAQEARGDGGFIVAMFFKAHAN